jgi:anaerobic selenocysteine-containing dehydrogenase
MVFILLGLPCQILSARFQIRAGMFVYRKASEQGTVPSTAKQAAHAVSLYFQMHDAEIKAATTSTASHYPAAGEESPQKKVSDSASTPISPPFQDTQQPHAITEKGLAVPRQSSGSHYIVNGDALRKPDLRRGTRSSPICRTRSRPATIPGKY